MNFFGSMFSKSSMRKQLIVIIVLTLGIGLGGMTFFTMKFFIQNINKVEEDKIRLLSSTLMEVIREHMISGNAKLISFWLYSIEKKGLKDVRMFRSNGVEAFTDNKTINSVNNFLGTEDFPVREDGAEDRAPVYIEPDKLKRTVDDEELSYNELKDGEEVHTMLFPILKEEVCTSCHGYEDNKIRGFLKISVSRAELLKTVKSHLILSVVSILLFIVLIGLIMNRLINIKIIKPITEAIFKITSAAAQQDQITSLQASSINEITTTIEELNVSSKQVYEKADSLAQQSKITLEVAFEGQNAVENSISEMNLIKEKVEAIAEEVLTLSENTNQIGAIINVVEDIANKTDMLALNAAIEAAKAGEQGKGFAVVASEVRSLADQSKKATEKVETLIQDIQKAVNSTVMATEDGAKKVDQGVKYIFDAGSTIKDAIKTFRSTTEAANEITIAARQESLASDQVTEAMHQINVGMKDTNLARQNSLQIIKRLYKLVDVGEVERRELGGKSDIL